MRGEGKYSWPDGSSYEGEVFDGLRHGYGVFTGPHGMCRYAGAWRAGRRHGKGRLDYDPRGGSYYEGEWEDDEKHGQVRAGGGATRHVLACQTRVRRHSAAHLFMSTDSL